MYICIRIYYLRSIYEELLKKLIYHIGMIRQSSRMWCVADIHGCISAVSDVTDTKSALSYVRDMQKELHRWNLDMIHCFKSVTTAHRFSTCNGLSLYCRYSVQTTYEVLIKCPSTRSDSCTYWWYIVVTPAIHSPCLWRPLHCDRLDELLQSQPENAILGNIHIKLNKYTDCQALMAVVTGLLCCYFKCIVHTSTK